MRVTIVNPVWDPRAPTIDTTLTRFTTLTGWASAVAAAGAHVVVCQRFRETGERVVDGVAYRFVGGHRRPSPPRAPFDVRAFARVVAETAPDVVHVNGLVFPDILRLLRRQLAPHVAIAVQDHGGVEPSRLSRLSRAWIRRGLAVVDAVLMASPGHLDQLQRANLTGPHTLLADVMESSTAFRAGTPSMGRLRSGVTGAPALLWVGRLNENKDPLTVLDGVAPVLTRHPAGRLTMVYEDAALERPVRQRIDADGRLRGRVVLAGPIPHADLASWFDAADIFVLGSHHEGSGYAVIEAMACGAVPVVTDIPSFRALTAEGAVGALWRAGDASACTSALERVLSSPLAPQRQAAMARFEYAFTWDAIGLRATAIYRMISQQRPRAAGATPTTPTRSAGLPWRPWSRPRHPPRVAECAPHSAPR